jgi:hypothetical protein
MAHGIGLSAVDDCGRRADWITLTDVSPNSALTNKDARRFG